MKKNNFNQLVVVFVVTVFSLGMNTSSVTAMPHAFLNNKEKIKITYSNLPLSFEINNGQSSKQVKFLSKGNGYNLFLTPDEAVLRIINLSKLKSFNSSLLNPHSLVVRMKLVGANSKAKVSGADKLGSTVNYFIGNDPKKWQKNIATFSKVKYKDIYPGIDLVYYGNQEKLEYDFVVSPGADPDNIKLAFYGTPSFKINAKGELILNTNIGEVIQHTPIIYQEVNGVRTKVQGGYRLENKNLVSFQLGNYDTTRPLIIDPVLVYSTFLGGVNNDFGWNIKVDSSGNAYVVGSTLSISDFPTTSGVVQPKFGGGAAGSNIFVTKFNASGTPVYSTYLGGSGLTFGFDIAIDKSGNAYVAGTAYGTTDFPTTMGAFQTTFGGGAADAVVAKLNPSGSSLVFSTFLGGTFFDGGADQFGIADEGKNGTGGIDDCNDGVDNNGDGLIDSNDPDCSIFDSFWHMGIDLDDSGNVYIAGTTFSPNFPVTMGALQTVKAGSGPTDAFVTKLNPSGSALIYSTYLGGASGETGSDVEVDKDGNAYVVGTTGSTDFPTTQGSFLATLNSPGNGYVAKLNPSGSALVYSSYLGASSGDQADSIAVDKDGNAYVTGLTAAAINPPFFPITDSVFQMDYAGGVFDAYVTKVNPDGSMLLYSTFLGGTQAEHGNAIAVDASGNAYVIGHTNSNNFPTKDPIQTETGDGGFDVFVTKLNPSGSALEYSTYLGGSQLEDGLGIAVDTAGAAYVTGYTEVTINPPNFPTTEGAFQAVHKGNSDAFVAKISGTGSLATTSSGGSSGAVSSTDLTGSWKKLTSKCKSMGPKTRCKLKGLFKIQNTGTKDVATSTLKFFLSDDSTFESGDTFLKQVVTGTVKAGGSKIRILSGILKTNTSGKFIIAVLDADGAVDESDETNNTAAFGPLP